MVVVGSDGKESKDVLLNAGVRPVDDIGPEPSGPGSEKRTFFLGFEGVLVASEGKELESSLRST